MSPPGRRLAATLGAIWLLLVGSLAAHGATLPDSTWVALTPVPQQNGSALFGLAVDPSNNRSVLAGGSSGSLFRSTDGGSTWSTAYRAKSPISTITFSPLKAGLVLAGTEGSGAATSRDGGATWSPATGLEGRSVWVFGFALAEFAAGTDHGVYVSQDGSAWTQAGLAADDVRSLAIEAIHDPVRLVAGADSVASGSTLSLYQSLDGGVTWTSFNPPISGRYAVRLAAGPLPPTGNTRPLEVGTDAGLFQSTDDGTTFTPLSGGDLLPSTDYSQAAFVTDHSDRFYVASDGGASGAGGLWRTKDAGSTFASMDPPVPAVTALAVSNDEAPVLYVATIRPFDQVVGLWAFHDTGGSPVGPTEATTPASGARTNPTPAAHGTGDLLSSPELPYLVLGAAALSVLLAAGLAHLRGRSH